MFREENSDFFNGLTVEGVDCVTKLSKPYLN